MPPRSLRKNLRSDLGIAPYETQPRLWRAVAKAGPGKAFAARRPRSPAMEQPRQDGLVPCIILQALWGVFLDKNSLSKL